MSVDTAMRNGDGAANWKSQLRDALWRQPSAPFKWANIVSEIRFYHLAMLYAAVPIVIIAGFIANWIVTVALLLVAPAVVLNVLYRVHL